MKIKKTILSLCIVLSIIQTGLAQASLQDLFDKSQPITWLGLDFSGAKLIGDREKYGSSSDIKFLIKSWNDLIEKEYGKYNIGDALRKSKTEVKIDITRTHNEELDVTELMSNDRADFQRLKEEDIASLIKAFDFQGLTGLGVIFNIESFNKLDQKASIWVTFIDLGSKEVLLTERLIEGAGGAGLRNYWARSIFDAIDRIKARQYDSWRKKYSK